MHTALQTTFQRNLSDYIINLNNAYMLSKNCEQCEKEFSKPKGYSPKEWKMRRFCSKPCFYVWSKGKPSRSPGTTFVKGQHPNRTTEFKKGRVPWNKGMKGFLVGDKNPAWKGGLAFRKPAEKKHICSKYMGWMKAVKNRDEWKCRIANVDCNGRLEAHHILNWRDYPELRYEINNGITLCQAHHPRKRAEEKRLAPFFMELVTVSSV